MQARRRRKKGEEEKEEEETKKRKKNKEKCKSGQNDGDDDDWDDCWELEMAMVLRILLEGTEEDLVISGGSNWKIHSSKILFDGLKME